METFRTIMPPVNAPFTLTHADHLVLVGSCFTEHLGDRLRQARFRTLINPNGIVFNPVSIGQCIGRALAPEPYSREALFLLNDLWHSWDHHGHFSAPSAAETLDRIRHAFEEARGVLTGSCTCLMITLGTSQVHRLVETGQVVANNHKAPAAWFTRHTLGVQEVVDALAPALESLTGLRPALRVVLTVSPVRHLRLGMVENQRSKAALVLACAELERRFSNAWYFPAYELLLDDLRDYRFYAPDMLHPSAPATQYIWDYFCRAFFTESTAHLVHRLEKLQLAAAHRPFNPETPAHQQFCLDRLAEIADIRAQHPDIDLTKEKKHFEQLLNR